MYHGEELINVDKMDLSNEEVKNALRLWLKRFFSDSQKGLKEREARLTDGLEKLNGAYERSNADQVENKKSLLSNILFIIGSIFSPEHTPAELYGKQHMPQGKRAEMTKFHNEVGEKIPDVEGRIHRLDEFMILFDKIKNEVMNNDEKTKNFLRAAIKAYKENEFSAELVDTAFFLRLLCNAGYVREDQIRTLVSSGVNFLRSGAIQADFLRFNDWYIKTIGNNPGTVPSQDQ